MKTYTLLGTKKVFLVTGGAGFIGSHLCEELLNLGYEVRCLDNLSTGKEEYIKLFINNPNYKFFCGDIRESDTCQEACYGVDYVLHQAAWGSVPRSFDNPVFYGLNNIQGTLNMLEAAKISGVKAFIYASSSSVYGDKASLPDREGNEGNILSPYALTKRDNEEWAKLYAKYYGLKTVGLRYFNVFGPRQNSEGKYVPVIPRFIKSLMNDKIPKIEGTGQQSRDFTYVKNIVDANILACLAPEEASGEVFNIAMGENRSVLDIYYAIMNALGKNIEPEFEMGRVGDMKHTHADISKAKQILCYDPQYSFEKGLKETIKWYQNEK